ncbi:hypothetical protein [Rhodococcus sp. NPDC127528]|uniref:hypothetical protein n=1 Tax=unclassified Rhodococcus (in: high G+C Gram-positive bacteria) TaxID=192944 RepID=UPI003643272A
MKRGSWASDYDALVRYGVNRVIRSSTLKALGAAPSTISSWCLPGGPWQRLLPGIVLLHNGFPTQLERATAALMYGGPGSLLSGHAALAAHGYQRSAAMNDVLLLIPQEQHRASCGFVQVERTWRMPDPPVVRGTLRCAPVVRATLDTARRLRNRTTCQALLADVVQRGDTSVEELAIELSAGSRRGTALPRSVLRDLGGGAHSVEEIHAHKLYTRSGLPAMVHNREIETATGQFIAIPDGWIDDVAMAWEIDSLDHHFTPRDHQATLERRARMQSHGIVVLAHLPRTLRDNENLVLDQLRRNYLQAKLRPRPDVRLRLGN